MHGSLNVLRGYVCLSMFHFPLFVHFPGSSFLGFVFVCPLVFLASYFSLPSHVFADHTRKGTSASEVRQTPHRLRHAGASNCCKAIPQTGLECLAQLKLALPAFYMRLFLFFWRGEVTVQRFTWRSAARESSVLGRALGPSSFTLRDKVYRSYMWYRVAEVGRALSS